MASSEILNTIAAVIQRSDQPQAEAAPSLEPPILPATVIAPHPNDTQLSGITQTLWTAMHGGLRGWGTDEAAIVSVLARRSPDALAAIQSEYKFRYEKDLESELRRELSGSDLKRVEALLAGDQLSADAHGLYQALQLDRNELRISLNPQQAIALLESNMHDPASLLRAVHQQYPEVFSSPEAVGQKLLEVTAGGHLFDRANALLSGKINEHGHNLEDDLVQLSHALNFKDRTTVERILTERSNDEILTIAKNYQDQFLGSEKFEELPKGALTDHREWAKKTYSRALTEEIVGLLGKETAGTARLLAILSDDPKTAGAAELRDMIERRDVAGIIGRFAGREFDERIQQLEEFSEVYPDSDFTALTKEHFGETSWYRGNPLFPERTINDAERISRTVLFGGLSTAEEIIYTAEHGSDAELLAVLQGHSKETLGTAREEFLSTSLSQQYDSLDSFVAASLWGGSDEFRAAQALKGTSESIAELSQRAREEYNFQRGSGLANGVLDFFSERGAVLDRDIERVGEFVSAYQKAVDGADANGEFTIEDCRALNSMYRSFSDNLKSYIAMRETAGEVAGTTAAVGAAAASVYISGGASTPLFLKTLYAATSSGLGYVAGEAAVAGGPATTVENLSSGFATGAAEGSAFAMGAHLLQPLRQGAATTSRHLARAAAADGIDGAGSGALGGATREASNPDTWVNGVGPGVATVATTLGREALAGAVAGPVLSVAAEPVAGSALGLGNFALSTGRRIGDELRIFDALALPPQGQLVTPEGVRIDPEAAVPNHAMMHSHGAHGYHFEHELQGEQFERDIVASFRGEAQQTTKNGIADGKAKVDVLLSREGLYDPADRFYLNGNNLEDPFVGLQVKSSYHRVARDGKEFGALVRILDNVGESRWVPVISGNAPRGADGSVSNVGLMEAIRNHGGYLSPIDFLSRPRTALYDVRPYDEFSDDLLGEDNWKAIKRVIGGKNDWEVYQKLANELPLVLAGRSAEVDPRVIEAFNLPNVREPLTAWSNAVAHMRGSFEGVLEERARVGSERGVRYVMWDSNIGPGPAYPFYVPRFEGLTGNEVAELRSQIGGEGNIEARVWTVPPESVPVTHYRHNLNRGTENDRDQLQLR